MNRIPLHRKDAEAKGSKWLAAGSAGRRALLASFESIWGGRAPTDRKRHEAWLSRRRGAESNMKRYLNAWICQSSTTILLPGARLYSQSDFQSCQAWPRPAHKLLRPTHSGSSMRLTRHCLCGRSIYSICPNYYYFLSFSLNSNSSAQPICGESSAASQVQPGYPSRYTYPPWRPSMSLPEEAADPAAASRMIKHRPLRCIQELCG